MPPSLSVCQAFLQPHFSGAPPIVNAKDKKKEGRMETHLGRSSLVVLSTGMFLSDAALGLLNLMEGRRWAFRELSIHDWRKTASALDELGKWPLFWKRCVRVRCQVWRGGQPLHQNPYLYGALPTEGGEASLSPCNLRPKGGRSPSPRKHYSQLQLWQPSGPAGALTCNPKVACPLPPVTPRDSISSPSRNMFWEAVTLFSYPRNSSPVPIRPPKLMCWFDLIPKNWSTPSGYISPFPWEQPGVPYL